MKLFRQISLFILILTFAGIAAAQDTGSVKGKVRSEDGDGIPQATIIARRDGKDVKSTETDGKGKFKMSGLIPGQYNLVFEKNGYSTGVLYNVEIRRKKTNDLGDRLILTVDQGTLTIVEANVFNQNGFSLYGAKVVIEEILSDGTTKKVASGVSSRDGGAIFRFPEKPAIYRVTASVKDVSVSKEIEVNEAAIYRTAITLDLSKDN